MYDSDLAIFSVITLHRLTAGVESYSDKTGATMNIYSSVCCWFLTSASYYNACALFL